MHGCGAISKEGTCEIRSETYVAVKMLETNPLLLGCMILSQGFTLGICVDEKDEERYRSRWLSPVNRIRRRMTGET